MTTGTTSRTPRNHARRVEDLQDLQRRGLIRFLESSRPDGRPWTYTVEVLGERMDIPTRHVDYWLAGWRQAVAVMNGAGAISAEHAERNGTRQKRTLGDTGRALATPPTSTRRTPR